MAIGIKRCIEAFSKGYFLELVREAYRHPWGQAHRQIMTDARCWFGTDPAPWPCQRLAAAWIIDFILQARTDLYRRGERDFLLPDAPIGFDDLKVGASCRDSNTSFVYLLGFTDNIVAFDLIRRHLSPGTVAVDVGANVGMHSLVMSRCTGAGGRVLSFEPIDSIHARLRANITINKAGNIETRPVAVGRQRGTFRFDPNTEDFNIGKGHLSASGPVDVPVSTLDDEMRDVPERVSFIKIDVEGHELEVLQGGQKVLSRHKPVLLVEFNPEEYSFDALRAAVPYAARFFKVPALGDGLLQEVVHAPAGGDLLVVPE